MVSKSHNFDNNIINSTIKFVPIYTILNLLIIYSGLLISRRGKGNKN